MSQANSCTTSTSESRRAVGATRHFATVENLRTEVANARVWAGLHYRFSTVAGLQLGKEVADYDLDHAFNTGG